MNGLQDGQTDRHTRRTDKKVSKEIVFSIFRPVHREMRLTKQNKNDDDGQQEDLEDKQ